MSVIVNDSIKVSKTNTPTRDGERISSLAQMSSIATPYVGMRVYVENTGKEYVVTGLAKARINGVTVEDAVVDTYDEVAQMKDVQEKVANAVEAEKERAEDVEQSLRSAITTETNRASSAEAELHEALLAETSANIDAFNRVQAQHDEFVLEVNQIHNELQTAITAEVAKEQQRAEGVETMLQQAIETAMFVPVVEIGGVADATGLPSQSPRTDRIRCRNIFRKDIQRTVLTVPPTLMLWLVGIDKDDKVVGTFGSLWYLTTGVFDVYEADSKIEKFHFVFKRRDNGDVIEEDITAAKEYVADVLTDYSRISNYRLRYNLYVNPFTSEGSKIMIRPEGFGIEVANVVYYVADESKAMAMPYVFDFKSVPNAQALFLVVDTTKLKKANARNELSEVVSIKSTPLPSDIVMAYYYTNSKRVVFLGQFATFYNDSISANRKSNEAMFAPEFYAYKWGRKNKANGVGTGWYQRFRVAHISDVHSSWTQQKEAISVTNDKVHVLVNTGDDGNGTKTSDADSVKAALNASTQNISFYCGVPFIQVPGNHDVPGLTKQEYFERICSTIQQKNSNVVWGDAEGFRAYGYADFTGSSYEGDFRIIMLDPFDYNDGEFSTVYPHMSAVFSQKQIDWLIDTLLDAATKGLNVITTMHYSFGDAPINDGTTAYPDAAYCQDTFMIPDIIDAIQNKATLVKEYSDSKGANNISINRDFSSASELKFVAHLFGHIHSKNHFQCQKADGSKKYDILMLGETALLQGGTALNKVYREIDAVNGIAFSVLEIDTVEKAVYRVSYGAYLNYDKSNSERTTKIPYRFS